MEDHIARLRAWQKRQGLKPKRRKVHKKVQRGGHRLWYLIDWYSEIRAGIDCSMGYAPVSAQEMLAWKTLYGVDLDPFDADTIRRLDTVWLKSRPKPAAGPGESGGS